MAPSSPRPQPSAPVGLPAPPPFKLGGVSAQPLPRRVRGRADTGWAAGTRRSPCGPRRRPLLDARRDWTRFATSDWSRAAAAATVARTRPAPSPPSPSLPSAHVSFASPRPPHRPGAAGRQRQRQLGECGRRVARPARAGGARRPCGQAESEGGREGAAGPAFFPRADRGAEEGAPSPRRPQPPPAAPAAAPPRPPQTKRLRWEAGRAVPASTPPAGCGFGPRSPGRSRHPS